MNRVYCIVLEIGYCSKSVELFFRFSDTQQMFNIKFDLFFPCSKPIANNLIQKLTNLPKNIYDFILSDLTSQFSFCVHN